MLRFDKYMYQDKETRKHHLKSIKFKKYNQVAGGKETYGYTFGTTSVLSRNYSIHQRNITCKETVLNVVISKSQNLMRTLALLDLFLIHKINILYYNNQFIQFPRLWPIQINTLEEQTQLTFYLLFPRRKRRSHPRSRDII